MRNRALALAAVLVAMIGCAPAKAPSRAPSDEPSRLASAVALNAEAREVSSADAIADLDEALRVFDEAYAGVEGRPRVPSAERVEATKSALLGEPRWAPEALANVFRALFAQPDGHLAIVVPGVHRESLPCFSHDRAPSHAHSLTAIGRRRHAVERATIGGVPVVAIHTFASGAADELEALPAIARELRQARSFVVDLRGNTGGNYGLAEPFIAALTNATLLRLGEREVVSVAAAEGRTNEARMMLAHDDVPAASLPIFDAHLAALDAEATSLRASGAARTDLLRRRGVLTGTAPSPLGARAIFLVDGDCASACEMTLALARQIPSVVVAGEPTRGAMAVGEVALFRLPRSGLNLSLGTRAFQDPLGDFDEQQGFVPDLAIDGEDLLAGAVRLATSGARAGRRGARVASLPSRPNSDDVRAR